MQLRDVFVSCSFFWFSLFLIRFPLQPLVMEVRLQTATQAFPCSSINFLILAISGHSLKKSPSLPHNAQVLGCLSWFFFFCCWRSFFAASPYFCNPSNFSSQPKQILHLLKSCPVPPSPHDPCLCFYPPFSVFDHLSHSRYSCYLLTAGLCASHLDNHNLCFS